LWRRFVEKPVLAKGLLMGAPFAVLLFLIRPAIALATDGDPIAMGPFNIGVLILVNFAMVGAAYLGILFIYFQARLLERSAFGKDVAKLQSVVSLHSRTISIVIAITQTCGFMFGALGGFYAPWLFPPRIFYFGSLIFIDMTCIPMFATICILIYARINKETGMRSRHKALARQLLIVSLGCIGSASGTMVGSILGCLDIWPFIANLIPLSAVAFFLFMFALIARKPNRKPMDMTPTSRATPSGKLNSHSTGSTKSKSKNSSGSSGSHIVVTEASMQKSENPS
jgi:hypothetical protein